MVAFKTTGEYLKKIKKKQKNMFRRGTEEKSRAAKESLQKKLEPSAGSEIGIQESNKKHTKNPSPSVLQY